MLDVRFASRSARKHKIGRASALYVMERVDPIFVPAEEHEDDQLLWIGTDERGRELEIVAAIKPDCFLVIHVMPTAFRE